MPTRQPEMEGRWKRALREFVNDGLATTARVDCLRLEMGVI